MMIYDFAGRVIFLIFIAACVIQDLLEKAVDLRIFLLMFSAEAVWLLQYGLSGHRIPVCSIGGAVLISVFLYGVSRLTEGELGSGDALYFTACAPATGLKGTLLILLLSLFLAGFFSLVLLTYGMLRNRSMRRKRIPFLPFAAVPSLFLVLLKSGMIGGL